MLPTVIRDANPWKPRRRKIDAYWPRLLDSIRKNIASASGPANRTSRSAVLGPSSKDRIFGKRSATTWSESILAS